MKKELTILGLALAPALAPSIGHAAATKIAGGATVDTVTCTLLQDNLTLRFSNGVVGAYNCNTSANLISLATCHTAGRVASRTSTIPAPVGCGGTTTVACTGTTTTTASGAIVPTAHTNGGSLDPKFPGGACDTAGTVAANAIP